MVKEDWYTAGYVSSREGAERRKNIRVSQCLHKRLERNQMLVKETQALVEKVPENG